MTWTRLTAAISTGLLTVGCVTAPPWAAQTTRSGAPTAPQVRSNAGSSTAGGIVAVRLITGDRVTVTTGQDGRRAATVEPGPGRHGIIFQTREQNGDMTVLPSDAAS